VPTLLRLSVHTRGRGLVVAEVSGEIDLMTAPDLVATLQAPQVSPPGSLVLLDLSGLGFCDVTGLNALVRARRILGEHGAWLALAAPPQSVLKLLAITGLDQLFEVFPQPARPQELPQPQAKPVRVPREALRDRSSYPTRGARIRGPGPAAAAAPAGRRGRRRRCRLRPRPVTRSRQDHLTTWPWCKDYRSPGPERSLP
jgi:anti-sigma B factor antagonist